jgi:hypothetical protein
VLKHYPLSGLNPVGSPLEHAGNHNVRRARAWIVHTRVAVLAQAYLHLGCAGAADEDAEIGRQHYVGIFSRCKACLDRAAVERQHQTRCFTRRHALIRRHVDRG